MNSLLLSNGHQQTPYLVHMPEQCRAVGFHGAGAGAGQGFKKAAVTDCNALSVFFEAASNAVGHLVCSLLW